MIELCESNKSFRGFQEVYEHQSSSTNSKMRFGVYKPEEYKNAQVLFFLSGITCTEQNFIQKSGFQKYASEKNIAVVVPDTSPRGTNIPDSEDFKLGCGAGFYLNATKEPWSKNYHMYDYITDELPKIIEKNFEFNLNKLGIFGHSMGGGGAIQIALKNSNLFKSVSAFSPICSILKSNFSQNAIKEYLDSNNDLIKNYDPINLIKESKKRNDTIKIDVGLEDEYLDDLFINEFKDECSKVDQKLDINFHEGYGHSYYFIHSLIESHFIFHSSRF